MPRRGKKRKLSASAKAGIRTRKKITGKGKSVGLDGDMTSRDGIMAQIEKQGPVF